MGNNSATVHSRRLTLDEKFVLVMVGKASLSIGEWCRGRRSDAFALRPPGILLLITINVRFNEIKYIEKAMQ